MTGDLKRAVDDRKTKAVVLGGFLGSGKTTLLKRILSWKEDLSDTVVIVNDFGKVGIDGDLLREAGSDMVELSSGCICCTLRIDLERTLERILSDLKPKWLFIETTGVADPAAVLEALGDKAFEGRLLLHRMITVLDVSFWEARECFGPVFFNQLREADLVLLNKIDTIDAETVPLFLQEIHEDVPDVRIVPTIHCNMDMDLVVGSNGRGVRPITRTPDFLVQQETQTDVNVQADRAHSDGSPHFISFSFKETVPMDRTCLDAFLKSLPWALFRIKGPVRFDEATFLLNYVGGIAEWSPWDGREMDTRLAFVGWDVDEEEIVKQLQNCCRNPV